MATLFGWLFDAYPSGQGMTVWLIDPDGRAHPLQDSFTPAFYVSGPSEGLRAVAEFLRGKPVNLRRTERIDLFLDHPIEVLEVAVRVPGLLPRLFQQTSQAYPNLTYYDADIPLPQRYILARQIFPLAYCAVDQEQGQITRIEALGTPWEVEYRLPPLRVMTLRLEGELQDPTRVLSLRSPELDLGEPFDPSAPLRVHGLRAVSASTSLSTVSLSNGNVEPLRPRRAQSSRRAVEGPKDRGPSPNSDRGDLLVEVEGQRFRFSRRRGRTLILGLRHLLERHDPDVLLTAYGDNYILPRLLRLARHYGIPLPLNRDSTQGVERKGAHSYFSYGRVMFRDEQHTLFGRWHIDRQNAFLSNYYGLDGILEIARVSGLPVQTVARVSTGTGISAMQVATAQRRGVLVPWQKRQPESLKSVPDLLTADKGGLVYTPVAGLYEGVAELDFTAMYPSIMVHFNISPETVEAKCCEGEPVPELGTSICRHRQGLVPETLAPLLEKRNRYKALIRELPPGDPLRECYERRYSAHKWLLVTCFGYLGYKNARFGRIEAHEAVNAYGREVLLTAKELVEAEGFRVLHLYVDGLWIHKPGVQPSEYEALLERIHARTGLQVGLEGIYRWLAFLPSRTEPRVAVANRYFGAFEDGSLKLRGIEARRHDTPPFIKDTQLEILAILAQARGVDEFRATLPQAVAHAQAKLRALRAGRVPAKDLVVTHRLSRELEEYRVRTAAARAAQQLARAGVQLSPGEMMHFVYVTGPEKVRPWEAIESDANSEPLNESGQAWNRGEGSGQLSYDSQAYTELLLRAVESLLSPLGVDRPTLQTWLLGDAGYWGPPGILPPPGADIRAPLLEGHRLPRPGRGFTNGTVFYRPPRPEPAEGLRIPLALDYKTSIAQGVGA